MHTTSESESRTIRLTVHLGAAQVAAINQMAAETHLSASALARMAIGFMLRNPDLFLPTAHAQNMQHNDVTHAGAAD